MMSAEVHGPALVRIGHCCTAKVREFYVVFWHGAVQPAEFDTYGRAEKEWKRLDDLYARTAEVA